MKLDIGCGAYKREGYLGVDPYVETDFCAPMWAIPVEDSSVDEIYSSHALEHIGKFEVVPTLREWARILKSGGQITLQVPDLVWCCEQWLARQTTDWYMDILFGMQNHAGEFHKTGFTPAIMQSYLAQAGLTLLQWQTVESHGQPTLEFIVTKEVSAATLSEAAPPGKAVTISAPRGKSHDV